MESKKVTLDTINSGAAIDLFQEEFDKLLKNLADENTKAITPRSVTLKITVRPIEDRSQATTTVEIKSTLAPMKPHTGTVVFSSDGIGVEAYTVEQGKQKNLEGLNDPKVFAKAANGEGGK